MAFALNEVGFDFLYMLDLIFFRACPHQGQRGRVV